MTPSYDQYTVREFVTDDAFIAWVKYPNDATNAFWQQWLQQHPEKQADVQQARLLVGQLVAQRDIVSPPELDADWQRIRQRLHPAYSPAPIPVVRPLWQRQWGWAAAAAAILLLIGINYWPQLTAPGHTGNQPLVQQSALLNVVNRTRQVLAQQLPDGTIVWMTPDAQLTYPRQFVANERTIQFRGEGFFEVTKDAARPFVIHSGKLKTRVLGTSFNLKADEGSDTYAVSVVTGKVAVSAPVKNGSIKTVLLIPQQRAVFALTAQQLAVSAIPVSSGKQAVWQPVSLDFDDATLSEVAKRLEQTFDATITLSNPALTHCRLTVDFNQQRLAEILEQINKLLNTTYTLNGNRVELVGEGCEP